MKENIKRYNPDIKDGLSSSQVDERIKENLVNYDTNVPTKSIKTIIVSNFFTIFNLINLFLAAAVFSVGEYKNMLFIFIIIINTAISTIQEIHSKKIIDKLSLISNTKVNCIRGGESKKIAIDEIVLDDIISFETGNQVVTDCILMQGEIEVDESFITGEADHILKKEGDMVLSGSFIVSGKGLAKVEHIGEENFTSKISKETKYIKKAKSEIMTSLNKIIKTVSILIIPIGLLLFYNQCNIDGGNYKDAVIHTVAAIIGMIPEGLILLTSTVLAVSVIRLSKSKVLVQELYCIETLARVDTLCLDKTGTITEGKMEVNKIVPESISNEEFEEILAVIGNYSEDNNATINAIRDGFNEQKIKQTWNVEKTVPFSSQKKWSGVEFKDKGSYIIGATEFILKEKAEEYQEEINEYANDYRVILLAHSKNSFKDKELPEDIEVLGFVLITDKIRENAEETLKYFKEQGVDIRIISGDNPVTVSKIAKRAGVEGYEKYIDCTTLEDEEALKEASKKYKVFGRVTPNQKKELVKAMQSDGHTVAMTGDGVNDILAMKDADCSIAMASGSEATAQSAQVVLLESDFSKMPSVVLEGRRVVNNVQRSASLFLVKNIFSFLMSIFSAVFMITYPLEPSQISLISMFNIGIPAFLLAMEANKKRIEGKFLRNVFIKALPAGLTDFFAVAALVVCGKVFKLPSADIATAATMLLAIVGFMILSKISVPLNRYRIAVIAGNIAGLLLCSIFLGDIFALNGMSKICILLFVVFSFASESVFRLLYEIAEKISEKFKTESKK